MTDHVTHHLPDHRRARLHYCCRYEERFSEDPVLVLTSKRRERKRPPMSVYHEVMEAFTPLVDAFDQLGIADYIGGSVSSSLHGLARRTQDVAVIADFGSSQVLQNDYYLDEQAWRDAVGRGLPCNVIHLNTMLKGDLIPLKRRAFTREEARRAQTHILEAGTRPLRVAMEVCDSNSDSKTDQQEQPAANVGGQ